MEISDFRFQICMAISLFFRQHPTSRWWPGIVRVIPLIRYLPFASSMLHSNTRTSCKSHFTTGLVLEATAHSVPYSYSCITCAPPSP
jgi:hypothetical protein